jgi:MFS family permease
VLSSYRQIFTARGSLRFSAAGLVSRMPLSMTGIGIVTMLSQLRGEYRLAGAVSATMALAAAVIGPQVSRLVDRYGQRNVALPAAGVATLAMGVLLLCAHLGAPDWTLFGCALVAGCMPSMGALVRARWAEIYRGTPLLHTAYSLESVVDEIIFIIGPILSVGLSTAVFPEAGPLLAAVFLAVGATLFCLQRSTEPPVHPETGQAGGGSALGAAGLRVVVLTFVAVGGVFGSVEVVTVAFADHLHHKALSSLVLAVYALGSGLAGLVFGTLRLRGSAARRFLLFVSLMALSMLPLLIVTNLVALAAALFVAGMSIAPTMVTTMALVERLVPAAQFTEGTTWTSTGLAVGVALGSSAGGWVVDASGASAGYLVTVASAALAVATAFLGARRLHAAPEREAGQHGHDAEQVGHAVPEHRVG